MSTVDGARRGDGARLVAAAGIEDRPPGTPRARALIRWPAQEIAAALYPVGSGRGLACEPDVSLYVATDELVPAVERVDDGEADPREAVEER